MRPAHPTIIVVHASENPRKCTVQPLRGRPGFEFLDFQRSMTVDFPGPYVRLGMGGPVIGPADGAGGLFVLDATWRHADEMAGSFGELPVRSLPPLATAYPRTSKHYPDPEGGLATIEALYAAYRLLGWEAAGMLDHYHWRDRFLELNATVLGSFSSVGPASRAGHGDRP